MRNRTQRLNLEDLSVLNDVLVSNRSDDEDDEDDDNEEEGGEWRGSGGDPQYSDKDAAEGADNQDDLSQAEAEDNEVPPTEEGSEEEIEHGESEDSTDELGDPF